MLDFSWSHILLLLIVALVVVGPKDLPKLMRMVGRWTGKARAMADQLRKSFDEMARQSELEELRAEIEALRAKRSLTDIDYSLRQPMRSSEMPALPHDDPSPHAEAPQAATHALAEGAPHEPSGDATS